MTPGPARSLRRGRRAARRDRSPYRPGPADPVARAARTADVVAARPGWVWPWWLERQLDPASAAWSPAVPLGLLPNSTGRSWTRLGTIDGTAAALVDPRGLVVPAGAAWSVDWWVGADDRWHHPSREVAVRQRLLADAPIVETAMRIPGGDALQRVYAVRLSSHGNRDDGGDGAAHAEALVVEVENDSAVPFALALAVRPLTTDGVGAIAEVTVTEAGVQVDGRPALVLARTPPRAAAADGTVDVAALVAAGGAGEGSAAASSDEGLAQAAVVLPVPHTATVRALVPIAAGGRLPAAVPPNVPAAADVARGWAVHAEVAARLEPGDQPAWAPLPGARRHLLVDATLAAQPGHRPHPRDPFDRAALVLALAETGRGTDAAAALAHWLEGIDEGPPPPKLMPTAVALAACGQALALLDDQALVDAAVPVMARAGAGLASSLAGAEPGALELVWSAAAMAAVAPWLALREPRAAADARALAATLAQRRDRALASSTALADHAALLRAGALGALDPADPATGTAWSTVVATVEGSGTGLASPTPGTGGDPSLTLDAALVALHRSESPAQASTRGAGPLIASVVAAASPTAAWPAQVDPRSGHRCAGDGHDPGTTARFVRVARHALVTEGWRVAAHPDDQAVDVALCSYLGDRPQGQAVEAHGVPTAAGLVSFAVRWHGPRPALLWEVQPYDRRAPATVRLRAPGLDPSWSSEQLRGEALLAPAHRGSSGEDGTAEPEGTFS